MQTPSQQRRAPALGEALVKLGLVPAVGRHASATAAEEYPPASMLRNAPQKRQGGRRQQLDLALFQLDFRPFEIADFRQPLPREHQQLDDDAEVVVSGGQPDFDKF